MLIQLKEIDGIANQMYKTETSVQVAPHFGKFSGSFGINQTQ
jgi:hypothetical protein